MFIEYVLRAGQCAKSILYINSFNSHNGPMRLLLLIFPLRKISHSYVELGLKHRFEFRFVEKEYRGDDGEGEEDSWSLRACNEPGISKTSSF